ncbi:8731_t:CDS:1, partial [Gigaspora rosea]
DYMLPCNTSVKVSFVIGGVEYQIKTNDLINGYFTSDIQLPPDGWCMSAIYADSPDYDGPWHLGGTFLSSIYAVFDYKESKVGLAHAAPRKK